MSRGRWNGRRNDAYRCPKVKPINFDFEKCETSAEIMRGLGLYFTTDELLNFRGDYFWECRRWPDGDDLLSWLIDKGYF